MDFSSVSTETDDDKDFNGTSRGTFTYRGAYTGMGTNPGWPLGDGMKGTTTSTGTGGGGSTASASSGSTASASSSGGAGGTSAAGTGGTGGGSPGASPSEKGGCGCVAAGNGDAGPWAFALLAIAGLAARRRERRAAAT